MNQSIREPVTQPTPKMRSSNLELFRIITMFLIIAHHYVVNSGLLSGGGPVFANKTAPLSIFLLIFGAFGKTGINCFVLISGYFMCRSSITAKKFCKLLFEVLFYRIVIFVIFLITGYETLSASRLLKLLFPINSVSDGFTGCFLLFFLFLPFLNILVRNMNELQHIKLLALCLFIYTFLGTIPSFDLRMNYVSWFIVLYFIGSYIRLYDKKIFSNTKFWGFASLFLFLCSAGSVAVIALYSSSSIYFFLADSNKILAVLLSVSSFLFFKNLNIRNSKAINTVAASAFGVLLIHANSAAMRKWLWVDLLNNVGAYHSELAVLHAIGSVLAIYVICTVIDIVRIRLIEKPFFLLWDKCLEGIKHKYEKAEEWLCKRLNIQK